MAEVSPTSFWTCCPRLGRASKISFRSLIDCQGFVEHCERIAFLLLALEQTRPSILQEAPLQSWPAQ